MDRNLEAAVLAASAPAVALRKESVDRNLKLLAIFVLGHSRSPQGERG